MTLRTALGTVLGRDLGCACVGIDPTHRTVIDLATVPGHVCKEDPPVTFTVRQTQDPSRVSVSCDSCRAVIATSTTRAAAPRAQRRHLSDCRP